MRRAVPGLAVILVVLASLAPGPAAAAACARCLPAAEQIAAQRARTVVPLAGLLRRVSAQGDILQACLCATPGGRHAYLLTVLRRDGTVARLKFDAATGAAVAPQ